MDYPSRVVQGCNGDFLVTIQDDSDLAIANLHYHQWDSDNETLLVGGYNGTIALTAVNGDSMTATIDGEVVGYQEGDVVAFWFEAVDVSPSEQTSRLPENAESFYYFDIVGDVNSPDVEVVNSPLFGFAGEGFDLEFEIIDAHSDVGSAKLYYTEYDPTEGPVSGGVSGSIDMMPGVDGIFTATIPGEDLEAGVCFGYYLVVSDIWVPANTDTIPGATNGEPEYNLFDVFPTPDVYWDFEADQGDFESSDESVWQWGNPEGADAGSYPTPIACSGSNVWATVIDGTYGNNVDATLTSTRSWVLEANAKLRFVNWYHTETWDGHNLQISTDFGNTWTVIEPIEGYTDGDGSIQGLDSQDGWNAYSNAFWQLVTFDLGSYADMMVMFRLRFGSDNSGVRYGAAIDDFMLFGAKDPGELEGYVTDFATGDPIENASLTVFFSGTTHEVSRTTTDQNGYYHLDLLPYTYDVTIRAYGYLNSTNNLLEIEENVITTENFSMTSGNEVCSLAIHVWGDMDNTIPLENIVVSIPELDTLMITDETGTVIAGDVSHSAYTIALTHVPRGYLGYHDAVFNEIEVTDRTVPLDLYMPEILPPQNLGGTNGDELIELSWDPPADQFTQDELEAIPGRLERLHEYYAGVLENGSDNDLKKLPQIKEEIFRLEQALLRYGNGSQLDELTDFQGYLIRINGEIWNEQPIQECYATISLQNGLEYICEVAAEYGYDPDYRVWSNPVTLHPLPQTQYTFIEVDYDWTELNPELGGAGSIIKDHGDDENSGFVDMGITFNFFSTDYTQIAICTNGWLSFSDDENIENSLTIPSVSDPNGLLVPLNVDMDLEVAVDDFKIWKHTDVENQLFIVQYYAKYYSDETETYSFQVVLNGNDNSVTYRYQSASQGWTVHDPVIGLENQDGTDGASYYNGSLVDNYAVSFTPTTECWGGIEGTLTDTDSGQPIAGVNVFAAGVNGLNTTPVQSDSNGFYQLPVLNRLLAPYAMTFAKDGYELLVVEDVDWPSETAYLMALDTTLTSLSPDSPPVIAETDSTYDDRFFVTVAPPGTHINMESTSGGAEVNGVISKKSQKAAKKQVTSTSLDEVGDVLWFMLQYSTEETEWVTYAIDGDTLFAPNGEFCDIPVILGSDSENSEFSFRVSAWMSDPEGVLDSLQTQWAEGTATYNMAPSIPTDLSYTSDGLDITLTVTPPTTNVDGSEVTDIALYKAWRSEGLNFIEVASSHTPEVVVQVEESGLYTYWVSVEDEAGNMSERTGSISTPAGNAIIETGFEEGNLSLFEADDIWECGTPTAGPGSAFEGQNVWATHLDGDYENGEFARLITSEPLTVLSDHAMIVYDHWYEFDEYINDGYNLSVSTDYGEEWIVIEPVYGYPHDGIAGLQMDGGGFAGASDGWQEVIFYVDIFSGQDILLSFNHGSDEVANVEFGVAIDNLKLYDMALPTEGSITGSLKICEASGEPVEGAEVWVDGWPGLLGSSNAAGQFDLNIPAGAWDIMIVHDDFWTQTVEEVNVTEDSPANLGEIYLTYPEGRVSPVTIDIIHYMINDEWVSETFEIESIGCGPLEYHAHIFPLEEMASSQEDLPPLPEPRQNIPEEAFSFHPDSPVGPVIVTELDETWDNIRSYPDLDELTGSTDNYGIAMGGNEFYVSNYYYRTLTTIDYYGNFISQIDYDESIVGTIYPGLFGIASDLEGYLYGSNFEGEVFKFLPDMSEIIELGDIGIIVHVCAYDWDNGLIYGSYNGLTLTKMDLSGSVQEMAEPPVPVYGLAYVPTDPDGYTLYGHAQTLPTSVIRYSPSLNQWDETPVATLYNMNEGDYCGDIASGIQGTYLNIMTGKQGRDSDVADLWEGHIIHDWITLSEYDGTIQPGESQQITVSVNPFADDDFEPEFFTSNYVYIEFSGPHMEEFGVLLSVSWGDGVGNETQLPTEYALHQNYPNPFNPTTSIKFALVKAQPVKLTVYNMLGQEVARLLDSQMEAGYHNVSFDASRLASGVYFYRLETPVYMKMKKMVMIK